MIFEYSQLRQFYKKMNELGSTWLFKDWSGERVFLLRHDVDIDIKMALNVAEIERQEDVVSTFFIRTSGPSYNILTKTNREYLRQISDMGHEIGLHFDPTLYLDDLKSAANQEAEILSYASKQKIRSISLHNPSVHGTYPMFEGYVNAYDPAMFSDNNYISDSRYSFRGKNPFEFINNIKDSMVQILLHPMHYSELGTGYAETVSKKVKEVVSEIHQEFNSNETYQKQVGEDFFETFNRFLP